MEEKNKKVWWQYFLFAVLLIVVYKIIDKLPSFTMWIKNFISVLAPFLMGILIAYILYLPARSIETLFKKSKSKFIAKRARGIGVFFTYLIAIIVVALIVLFIYPVIAQSIVDLFNQIPNYYSSAIKFIDELPVDEIVNKENIVNSLSALKSFEPADYINLEKITGYAKGVIGIGSSVITVFITLILSVYILLARGEILKFLQGLGSAVFKNKTYKVISKYFITTNQVFFKFISSQLLDAVVVGVITSIAMLILDVKYAVLLGFMIGLFNIIPYFGAIIAVVIAIIITIFTGGFAQAFWLAVIVIVLQQIDANIINPKIVGDSLKLNPILVILAVTLGGAYFGIIGMFLGVPVLAVIKIMIMDFIEYKNKTMQTM